MTFVSFRIAKAKVKDADGKDKIVSAADYAAKASIENNGLLTIKDKAVKDEVIYVTAVTNNGLSATVKVQIQ